jgi:hypothetical protein
MDAEGQVPKIGLTLHQWMTAADIASGDTARTGQWGAGRKPLHIRLILLALGHTSACTESMVVSTAPEQLALLSGTKPEAAADAVQTLLHDSDPLIVPAPIPAPLGAPACWLRIPQEYRNAAAWIRWRAKSITPTHPVFLVLGPAAGFTYSRLSNDWDAATDIAKSAKLSQTTGSQALKKLEQHRLAISEITQPLPWDRRKRFWRFSPVPPYEVAQETGALSLYEQRFADYAGDGSPARWPYIPEPLGLGAPVVELAP